MSDENTPAHGGDSAQAEHHVIHMPPPSFVPISVALSLATTFVGFIDQVRNTVGPLVWGIGLVSLIASCAVWFLAARSEFSELPDSLDGH